jgi:hypothetical protein
LETQQEQQQQQQDGVALKTSFHFLASRHGIRQKGYFLTVIFRTVILNFRTVICVDLIFKSPQKYFS